MKSHGTRPFGSWVGLYEEKSGATFSLEPAEEIVFHRDHGFFTWMIGKDYLHIFKMVGDASYFKPIIYEMLKKICLFGRKGILCSTRRNPKAFMRIFGGEVYKEENGIFYIRVDLDTANYKEG